MPTALHSVQHPLSYTRKQADDAMQISANAFTLLTELQVAAKKAAKPRDEEDCKLEFREKHKW